MQTDQDEQIEFELLGLDSLDTLHIQKQKLFLDQWNGLVKWLRTRGKDATQYEGDSESNVNPIARRIFQVYQYCWEEYGYHQTINTNVANEFLNDLAADQIRKNDGDPYAKASKRKFVNALQTYYRYEDVDWTPDVTFSDDHPKFDSDPFNREERESLFRTSLEYQKPRLNSNLSPDQRSREKAYIAQIIGKPKENVTRDDWDELENAWKIPSIISTTLDAGWRPAIFGRFLTEYVDIQNGEIHIPRTASVKNDAKWDQPLSERSVTLLENWLIERSHKPKYDDTDLLWLNREGNPYDSKSLNNLLRNLIEDAEIPSEGRTLTWYSIRHSTGMYIYDQEKDLGLVAELLRQRSLEAARRYAHPTPESKLDAVEGLQGPVYRE